MKPSRSPPARPYHHCPLTALVFHPTPSLTLCVLQGVCFPTRRGPPGGLVRPGCELVTQPDAADIAPPGPPISGTSCICLCLLRIVLLPTYVSASRIYSVPSRPPVFATSISVTPPHLDLPPPPSVTASNHPHATLPAQAALDGAGDMQSLRQS